MSLEAIRCAICKVFFITLAHYQHPSHRCYTGPRDRNPAA